METTTEQSTRRLALAGKAFDQFKRGLITLSELDSQLLLIRLGSYDQQGQGQ